MVNVLLIGSRRKIGLKGTLKEDGCDVGNILKNIPVDSTVGCFLISALGEVKKKNNRLLKKLKDEYNLPEKSVQYHGYQGKGYMSGNAPLLALHDACKQIQAGDLDFAIVAGYEPLGKGYHGKKPLERMAKIYGPSLVKLGLTIPLGYTLLAEAFCKHNKITEPDFLELAKEVNENLLKTANQSKYPTQETKEGGKKITNLFTARDCAFPWIDFAGGIILASEAAVKRLKGVDLKDKIYVSGIACSQISTSQRRAVGYLSPAYAKRVATFLHLKWALSDACKQAGINKERLLDETAVMEAYTCYPVIPLALLSEISPRTIKDTLDKISPLTVTGGMHYAGAPWCNPALNGLIAVHEKLLNEKGKEIGLVHGNGGTGEYQGICILRKGNPGKLEPRFHSFGVGKYRYNPRVRGKGLDTLLCTATSIPGNYSILLEQSEKKKRLLFSRRP